MGIYTSQLLAFKADWSPAKRLEALQYAMLHDAAEGRTGDMPGPVKRAVVDREKLEAYEAEELATMGLSLPCVDDDVKALVKVADVMDDLFHIVTEISMGNSLIRHQRLITTERFRKAVELADLPHSVFDQVLQECDNLDRGLYLPENTHHTDPLTEDPNWDIPF